MATLAIPVEAQPMPFVAAKRPPRFYRPELDVLRFFAFLLVFQHHIIGSTHHSTAITAIGSAGGFGVCLFFMLSSYLITELLFREREATGTIHLKSFYVRRILRIWPLYFLFLLAAFGLGKIFPSVALEPGRLIAFCLLAGNFYAGRHGWGVSPTGPLWSISVEEQFYLLWPTLAKMGSGALIGVSLMMIPLAYGVLFVPGVYSWTNSLVQFQFFAIGALLAVALRRWSPRIAIPGRAGLTVLWAACWLAASYWKLVSPVSTPLQDCGVYALDAAGCVALFFAFLGIAARFLPGWLLYLGKISYGLYVFHELAIFGITNVLKRSGFVAHSASLNLIRVPTSLLLTVGLAMLSYRYLESPFLRFKEKFSFVKSRTV